MTDLLVFGYGSLVNLATQSYRNPVPATLAGWRRVWCATSLREVAYLSVEPAAGSVIDGVVAEVQGGDWHALDLREAAYGRRDVTRAVTHPGPRAECAVYQVEARFLGADAAVHPILLSYLDTVVQGILRLHGPVGVARFFATTAGWDLPIRDDRADPVYPRAQVLSPDETTLVDGCIERWVGTHLTE